MRSNIESMLSLARFLRKRTDEHRLFAQAWQAFVEADRPAPGPVRRVADAVSSLGWIWPAPMELVTKSVG